MIKSLYVCLAASTIFYPPAQSRTLQLKTIKETQSYCRETTKQEAIGTIKKEKKKVTHKITELWCSLSLKRKNETKMITLVRDSRHKPLAEVSTTCTIECGRSLCLLHYIIN